MLSCGAGVVKSFPTLVGKKITDFFVLTKPFGIPFDWEFVSTMHFFNRNRDLHRIFHYVSL